MPDEMHLAGVRGTLIHTPEPGAVSVMDRALVVVNDAGWIESVHEAGSREYDARLAAIDATGRMVSLSDGQYLLPGLVDLHVHAPQWPQLGTALHLPLKDWLAQYTFPLEARYADLAFARRSYESLVDNLLQNGTTTATYFGTVHVAATKLLADIALQRGQRAVVGKVAMDNPDQCPDFYRDQSARQGLDGTREFIEYVRNLPNNALVSPAVTPRFIPSCTDAMLRGLGDIAEEYGCHVQTHCSESDWEHGYVIDRHGVRDTESLDSFGLLRDGTVLAHAVLIDDGDMHRIRQRKSGIAHCPLSNAYFSHSVFPARRALDSGLRVGLGTDISGGPSPSLLRNCQHAVTMSRLLEDGVDARLAAHARGSPGSRIDYREAFWMATAGGARVLGLPVGRFEPGYAFDALLVDLRVPGTDLLDWDEQGRADDVLQKIVNNAARSNIRRVWVQGRQVSGTDRD